MKNGLFEENGVLIYYKDGIPKHAGIIEVDGALYYISSYGRAVKGEYVVHGSMTNDLVKRGTYTFGDDYKLIKESYKEPKKRRKNFCYRIWKKLKKIKKKKEAVIKRVFPCFLLIIFMMQIILYQGGRSDIGDNQNNDIQNVVKEIILPDLSEEVLLCTQAAKLVYENEMEVEDAVQTGDPYRPFFFSYDLKGKSGVFYLSENENFEVQKEMEMSEGSTQIVIDNLKTATQYYYKVVVEQEEYTGTFRTAASTRYIKIPGVFNTRDIGGYTNEDGKWIKQGLLIRGTEYDGLVESQYYIPNEDISGVQETFGFVYDFDLRNPNIFMGQYQVRLGENVRHKFYKSPQYGQIFSSEYLASLKKIFSDLANPDNYPMYLHCTYGTDRTGTIIYLLQGILNMSEQDMVREYRLTGFYNKNISASTNMEVIVNGLQGYKGDTLQEKIVTYLAEVIGITEREIESIRSIFIEGYNE